jgi:hypothetical protein
MGMTSNFILVIQMTDKEGRRVSSHLLTAREEDGGWPLILLPVIQKRDIIGWTVSSLGLTAIEEDGGWPLIFISCNSDDRWWGEDRVWPHADRWGRRMEDDL